MTRDQLLARLKATPALSIPHFICPNPANAGSDTAITDELARISGGILLNHHAPPSVIEWGLGVSSRTGCKIALAIMDFGGYTFDKAGLAKVSQNLSRLATSYPQLKPDLIWFHNETVNAATRPLIANYYTLTKAFYPDTPVCWYGSGITIGQGATSRRAIYLPHIPQDLASFDLYMADTRLMRETIAYNTTTSQGLQSCPTITLLGSDRMVGTDPVSPVKWDRSFRYSPEVQRARAFMVLARSLRDMPLHSAVFYPFGPDKPEELEDFCNALISYACGYNQKDEPDIPDTPEVPEVPEEPDQPDVPDEPDIPDVPDLPNPPPVTAESLTPIARWANPLLVAPGTLVVVATSLHGIWGVEFESGGITVRGDRNGDLFTVDVPQEGVVSATVIGNDGGRRKLHDITVKKPSTRAIQVKVGENIADAIRTVGSGGTVYLAPGTHKFEGQWRAETTTCDNWITIDGGGQATIAGAPSGSMCLDYLKFQDITLKCDNLIGQKSSDNKVRHVWFGPGTLIASTGTNGHPVGNWRGTINYTQAMVQELYRVQGFAEYDKERSCINGLTVEKSREDCFQNSPSGFNIHIKVSDPGTSGDHADVIQGWGSPLENWLWYNVTASEVHYQGIFCRSAAESRNNAFINCRMNQAAPHRGGAGNAFTGQWNHLLVEGCDFTGANSSDVNSYADLMFWGENGNFSLKNTRFRNNKIDQLRAFVPIPDGVFVQNVIAGTLKDGI